MTIVIMGDDQDEIDVMRVAFEKSYPDATCIPSDDGEKALKTLKVISFCPKFILLDNT